jgi:hypothetical protein
MLGQTTEGGCPHGHCRVPHFTGRSARATQSPSSHFFQPSGSYIVDKSPHWNMFRNPRV